LSAQKVSEATHTTGTSTAVRVSASERLLGQVVADALRDLIGSSGSVELVDESRPTPRPERATGLVVDLSDVDIAITIEADGPYRGAAHGLSRSRRVDSLDQLARLAQAIRGLPVGSPSNRPPGAHMSGPGRLTDRELEVLTEMRRGASNTSIAMSLGISVHTVRSHIGSILRKLGTRSRVEAITRSS
jgi:DNA-binding CsgD family transcriptional regulator